MNIYNKSSKLDFGLYKGYELGIVYVFDPSYIEWCIKNLDYFYVDGLEELQSLGTFYNKTRSINAHKYGEPLAIPGLDAFPTFQDFIDSNLAPRNLYNFKKETIELNANKQNIKNQNSSHHSSSYEEHGGYNGYDDDTINNAFEGDAESTWNVD